MAPFYASIQPKTLIFDTGPLRELFLFQAVHDYKLSRLGNLLKHVKTRIQFRKLTDYIERFNTKTTTPLVVAEISYWIGEAEKRTPPGAVWAIAFEQFLQMHIDERLIKLLEMPRKVVERFGATDARVLQLGLSMLPERPAILTVERPMLGVCQRHQLEAIHIESVIWN
jgi:hypothetical protein